MELSLCSRASFMRVMLMVPWVVTGTVLPTGFRAFGTILDGNTNLLQDSITELRYGSVIELSNDGSRMAVGAPNESGGGVFLYDRQLVPGPVEDFAKEASWQLLWQSQGTPDKQLGENLSLSEDGKTLAIRRRNAALVDEVEVYQFHPSTGSVQQLGGLISPCGVSQGRALKLGKSDHSSTFGEATWLLASCEHFDKDRGKVEILRFAENLQTWLVFASIEGTHPSARFGWKAVLSTDDSEFLQVTVSSPNFSADRGLVQTFSIDHNGVSSQIFNDLIGIEQGDMFGFSLDMSTVGKPYLVVGAPKCNGSGVARGCVHVYSNVKGIWSMIGESLDGLNDNDKFGRSVIISNDGGRVAASSFHFQRQSGFVRVWDRDSSEAMVYVGDFIGTDPMERFGYSISMNEGGSLLAIGSPGDIYSGDTSAGNVQMFLDGNGFCSMPLADLSTEDIFLVRSLCRSEDLLFKSDEGHLLTSPSSCVYQFAWKYGLSCVWVDDLPVAAPSGSPTVFPTVFPSASPSSTPTTSPSKLPSQSPTTPNTVYPSQAPSLPPTADNPAPGASEAPTQPYLRIGANGVVGAMPVTAIAGISAAGFLFVATLSLLVMLKKRSVKTTSANETDHSMFPTKTCE